MDWELTLQEVTQSEHKMAYSNRDPDLSLAHNNGTYFVRPTINGKLAQLALKTKDGRAMERGWVFAECYQWEDDDQNERFDHISRGVLSGSISDLKDFMEMCDDLGLAHNDAGYFVPFSNGMRQHGRFEDKSPFADYSAEELAMARIDLPTRAQLETILRD